MTTTIEVIPRELKERIAALAAEAEALLPAVESLAERAWRCSEEYHAELDPIFDNDMAGEASGYHALLGAFLKLSEHVGAVAGGWTGTPEWLEKARAAKKGTDGENS